MPSSSTFTPILTYAHVCSRMLTGRQYPELVEVYTTQDKYALPVAGPLASSSSSPLLSSSPRLFYSSPHSSPLYTR